MRIGAIAAAFLLASTLAHAQPQAEKPSPGSWPGKVYRWSYNAAHQPSWISAEAAKSLFIEAARAWETCGIRMEYVGESAQQPGAMDDVNVVGWSPRLAANVRGVTMGRARAGQLIERDIAFNPTRGEFQRHPEWLRKVLMHEFGHAIGLTHSSRCDDVMTLAADCGRPDPASLPMAPTPRDMERCRALYQREAS
jgi:hypothetical protein